MNIFISLKLFGAIATDFGGKNLDVTVSNTECTLQEILIEIKKNREKVFSTYFDEDYSPKRGTLILINGVDFNTLDGLQTKLTSVDQISIIPTISGG